MTHLKQLIELSNGNPFKNKIPENKYNVMGNKRFQIETGNVISQGGTGT